MSNFTENGINFTVGDAGIYTGGMKISRQAYSKTGGNINSPQKIINAIDIDWNNAEVPGITGPISSTSQVLQALGIIKQQIQEIINNGGSSGFGQNHIMLTQEEYDALQTKNPNAVYFIIEGEGSGSGEDTPEVVIPTQTNLLINGNLHTENNIVLTAGATYTLQGTCVGTITVNAATAQPNENTNIRLNGVTLINNSNVGIKYETPVSNQGYKDLVITLEKNTINYVICKDSAAASDDQPGAIYSMNNLTIQGPGYLAVYNGAGHGIRGTEVKLLDPHIYVDAIHDGIHGKKIWICGGSYYIDNANDGFGTGIGGTIKWAYGDITINKNIAGKLMHAKSGLDGGVQKNGEIICVENNIITITGNPSAAEAETLVSTPSPVYLNDSLHNPYTAGTVKEYDTAESAKILSGGSIVGDSTGMYVVTKPFISVSGLITKPINIPSTISDVTIYLNDAAIITGKVNNINEPSIAYDATSSNIKILALKDTYNVIINNCPEAVDSQDADAVKSEHNIKVEIKNDAYLYVSSVVGDGLDGTDVNITDSKGVLMIHNCGERAIKGNNIIIGPSANTPGGSITLITDTSSQDYTTFDGAVIAYGNCNTYGPQLIRLVSGKIAPGSGYADIFARKGKAIDKGSFIVTANELNGIIACNTIGATISIDMDNSANIYYNELVTLDGVSKTKISPVTNENVTTSNIKSNITNLIE